MQAVHSKNTYLYDLTISLLPLSLKANKAPVSSSSKALPKAAQNEVKKDKDNNKKLKEMEDFLAMLKKKKGQK